MIGSLDRHDGFSQQWLLVAKISGELLLGLRGADGELANAWTDGLLFALGGPIYAGTNEIQRNIIAERLLGLPREKR